MNQVSEWVSGVDGKSGKASGFISSNSRLNPTTGHQPIVNAGHDVVGKIYTLLVKQTMYNYFN